MTEADARLLLPILKEVGKVICPPAALGIEGLYQIYTHADMIKDVGSAIMRNDYGAAVEAIGTQFVKDCLGLTVTVVTNQPVEQIAAATGSTAGILRKSQKTRKQKKSQKNY
jgi:hypothetical protein